MAAATDFLSFGFKHTDSLDIKTSLMKYVVKIYGKERAEDISHDIDEVMRRRTEVVHAIDGEGDWLRRDVKEIYASYYRALSVMETRFPISSDSSHAQVPFYWMNATNPGKKCKQMNIHFEKAAILFNIAIHLCQSAAQADKNSQSGYRAAMRQYQEAATAFVQTIDVASKIDDPKPTDLSIEFLKMIEKMTLAQGQECVFWIALNDQKSPLLLARVAKQTSILYAETLESFANPIVRKDLQKGWQDLVQSKSWLFEALCQYQAAEDARLRQDISTEISRLTQATELLKTLTKIGNFVTHSIPEYVRQLIETATTRLEKAKQENESVYLRKVTPFDQLPEISGAQLVRPSPCAYLDASSERIFADVFPESIMKALRRYAEQVDDLICRQQTKIKDTGDKAQLEVLQHRMAELSDAATGNSSATVLESLKGSLEEIEQCGGWTHIQEMLAELERLKVLIATDLEGVEKDLDEEAVQDAECREQYGEEWKVADSAELTVALRKIIASYRADIASGDKSDQMVQEKVACSTEKLAKLSVADCVERLPKLEPSTNRPSEVERQTVITNAKNLADEAKVISNEGNRLAESLEDMKSKDDVSSKLAKTGTDSHEELFRMELMKYDDLIKDIDQNMEKQTALRGNINKAYDDLQKTFDVAAWKKKADQYSEDIKADIAAFNDIQTTLVGRLHFYEQMKTQIEELKDQSRDFILHRRVERKDLLEKMKGNAESVEATASTVSSPSSADSPSAHKQKAQPFSAPTALHFAILISAVVVFFLFKQMTEE